MAVFMSQYNHTIDAKGRVIIPAKFREKLGDSFVVTKGLDGCLYGYAQEEWRSFEEKLGTLPITNKDSRQFTRFFLAGAAECELDKQGRILIPSVLREFAGLEKDVVLVGVASKIEIWSKERWDEANGQYEDNMDDIARNLESLGFSI
ncbi:MAG: division/cell wall cluster transcriptional repressor MraZ [Butyrivibrio sp.]